MEKKSVLWLVKIRGDDPLLFGQVYRSLPFQVRGGKQNKAEQLVNSAGIHQIS
jgi:hypothetical protein